MKKDVKPLEGSLERLLKLRGVTFEWIEPEKHGNRLGRQTGMIAQEVEKVFPDWVGTDAEGFKTLTFRGFEALSVEGLRALKAENDALRAQSSKLEERINALESNRRISTAGFNGGGLGVGTGLVVLAGAVVWSRRKRQQA